MKSGMSRMQTSEKEHAKRVHGALHKMLFVLGARHPRSEKFNAVFKENMFVKNNNEAFMQSIYYLLKIYNPACIKEKITQWPIINAKYEPEFRKQVAAYTKEISQSHPDFEIPVFVASRLVNPGGLGFAEFILALTRLVVFIELHHEDENLLGPAHSNASALRNFHVLTQAITDESQQLMRDFTNSQKIYEKEASEITQRTDAGLKDIAELKKTLRNLESQPVELVERSVVDELEVQVSNTDQIAAILKHCQQLVEHLHSEECFLRGPEDQPDALSLVQHFDGYREQLQIIKLNDTLRALPRESIRYALDILPKIEINLGESVQHTARVNQKCDDLLQAAKMNGESYI